MYLSINLSIDPSIHPSIHLSVCACARIYRELVGYLDLYTWYSKSSSWILSAFCHTEIPQYTGSAILSIGRQANGPPWGNSASLDLLRKPIEITENRKTFSQKMQLQSLPLFFLQRAVRPVKQAAQMTPDESLQVLFIPCSPWFSRFRPRKRAGQRT